jgi:hypothetical protein
VALEPPAEVPASLNRLGTVTIPRRAEPPIRYALSFQPGRAVQRPPEPEDTALPPEYDAVRELAAQVAGDARSPLAAALAVEGHLRTAYAYSTSTFAPVRQDPVRWFLFDSRAGHCEFFASSMVMMLRALAVPARLQAGYAGGEGDGRGGFLVRESQAHAWVVAWIGSRWAVFDPTPADGRPALIGEGIGWTLAGSWRQLEAVWDRWVLTFSLADQVDLVRELGPALQAAARRWRSLAAWTAAVAVALLLLRRLAPALGLLAPARRRGLDGALEGIASRARRQGVVSEDAATPRGLERAIGEAVPAARPPLHWLVARHERWRYAGGEAPPAVEVRRATRSVARALDRHARRPGSVRSGGGRAAATPR